jgi:hypothetical protein
VTKLVYAWITVLVLGCSVGCSIEHRSGALVCEKQADCPDGRLCQDGYCIFTGPIDAAIDGPGPDARPDAFACPEECTTCDRGTMTCNIDCAVTNCTSSNAPIRCPADWNCKIECSTANSCRDLDCTLGKSCITTCKGAGSCRDVTCGPGRCDFTCSGEQSCRSIDCDASCGCDVRCDNATSCPLPSNCPHDLDVCGTFEGGCTTQRNGCDTCQ